MQCAPSFPRHILLLSVVLGNRFLFQENDPNDVTMSCCVAFRMMTKLGLLFTLIAEGQHRTVSVGTFF